MQSNPEYTIEDLWRLNDAEADFIATQPAEELVADMHEDGEDVKQVAMELDALVLGAYKRFKQESLINSRRQYEEYLSKFRALTMAVPQRLKEKKEQWANLLLPSGLATATVQFRDLSDLTEPDLEAYYRSCQYLKSVSSV